MKKFVASITVILLLLCLGSCAKKVYQLPWDHFCYSADGTDIIELDADEKSYIIDLLNEGDWYGEIAKCTTDYKFSAQAQSLGYNCQEGIFNDFTLNRSLKVSEEDRLIINEFLGYNAAESKPIPEEPSEEAERGTEEKPNDDVGSNTEDKPKDPPKNEIDFTPEENKAYSFEDLYRISECINVDEISKIHIDCVNGSIHGAPWLHDVLITTDADVIKSVVDFINNAEFTYGDGGLDGGGAYKITLYEGEKSIEFSMSGKNAFYSGYYSFTSSINYPFAGKYDESYMYIEANGDVQLSSYGSVTTLPDFDISEIRLQHADVDLFADDYTKDADLIIDGKTFKISSYDTIHSPDWGWFMVVGEKNFADLIPKEETESYIKLEDDSGRELGRVIVSNNTFYSVDEIVEMLHHMVSGTSFEIFNSDGSPFTGREFQDHETLIVHITPRC